MTRRSTRPIAIEQVRLASLRHLDATQAPLAQSTEPGLSQPKSA
ncbi:hypothetical protein [Rubripirellula amarantea]|nr:hypothetical protein [Rubripirellula amarantea]